MESKSNFFTHSHIDHLASQELCLRYRWYCDLPDDQPIDIYCNEKCENEIRRAVLFDTGEDPYFIRFHRLFYFKQVTVAGLVITPMPSNHTADEDAMLFLIEQGEDRFFYCTDSGIVPEQTTSFLCGKMLNGVLTDCTYGWKKHSGKTHMGAGAVQDLRLKLKKQGSANRDTRWILSHFSHHSEMTHEEMTQIGDKNDFEIAYDGMIYHSPESV